MRSKHCLISFPIPFSVPACTDKSNKIPYRQYLKRLTFIIVVLCPLTSVSVFADNTIQALAGIANSQGYSGDGGPAISAQLNGPTDIAVDAAGNVYIADSQNNRVRKVDTSGIITTFAGTGTAGFSGDGGPAVSAELNNPMFVAVDSAGAVYIVDRSNRRVRKVDASGTIDTIAGNGAFGLLGDGGPALSASFQNLHDIAIDTTTGNVYIADWGDGGMRNGEIRKIDGSGIITCFAGGGNPPSGIGNGGPATSASMNPGRVALDGAGNVYLSDWEGNFFNPNDAVVRKVDASGTIHHFAGRGYSADGYPAVNVGFLGIGGVATDAAGNVYISDTYGRRVRAVRPSGIITAFAGNGTPGISGDGGDATAAQLICPGALTVDSSGNVYVLDSYAATVRKITVPPAGTLTGTVTVSDGITPFPLARVEIWNNSALMNVCTADPSGNYTATAPPGTYDLTTYLGFASLTQSGSVTSGGTTTADLNVLCGYVHGRVTKLDGTTPLPGACVGLYDGSDFRGYTTDISGQYSLHFNPGNYDVAATSLPFYAAQTRNVTVTNGSISTVDFSLALAPVDYVVTSDADSGPGTLRQAISDAVVGSTITFNLSAGHETISLASHILILKSVVIEGNNSAGSGVGVTVQVTTPSVSAWNVFTIATTDQQVYLKNLVMRGGKIGGRGGVVDYSGLGTGELIVDNCTLRDGVAGSGGGIGSNSGVVIMYNCVITSNTSVNYGGGIEYAGRLSMSGCTISSNTAGTDGGAIRVSASTSQYNFIIDKCTISGNTSTGHGGGIYAQLLQDTPPYSSINNSTINDNTARGSLHFGGGLYLFEGTYQITNCTLSGNSAERGGGAYSQSSLYLTNATVSGNSASPDKGGGLECFGTLYIKNSILAGNAPIDICTYGSVVDNGYNIVVSSSGYAFDAPGDMTGPQPDLYLSSSLAANDAPSGTLTLAISSDSIAVNAGNAASNSGVTVPATDQRGYYREGAPDIGAYEYMDGPVPVADFSGTVLSPGSIRWQWHGVAGAGGYRVKSSTGGVLTADLAVGATDWWEGGLAPNTTYYRYLEAFLGTDTSSSSIAGAATFAVSPNNIYWGIAASTSISVSWLDDTGNPPDTTYVVRLSTNPNFTGTVHSGSTVKASSGTIVTPLTPDTTYYGQVAAVSFGGISSSTVLYPQGVMTPAAAPLSASFTGVFATSATLSWAPNGNPPYTRYELSLSTDDFTTNFSTPVALSAGFVALSTAVCNLAPNTRYYARVRAFGSSDTAPPTSFSGVASAVTLASLPGDLAWGTVLSTSVSVTWNDTSGNPPDTPYTVQLSTRPDFTGTIHSSSTVKACSGAVVQPLTPNTTYYCRVNVGVNPPVYLVPAWQMTPAAVPLSPDFTGVFVTSVTVSWDPNGNPPGTRYEISVSTNDFTTSFSTPVPVSLGVTSPNATVNGLLYNTTYYTRIRAFDALGRASGFSSRISTATLFYHSFVVTSNADSGSGTLREAIACTVNGGSIVFGLGAGDETITLSSELTLNKSLTIDGSNAFGSGAGVTLKVPDPGVSAWRVFNVRLYPGKQISLKNLTMRGGDTSSLGIGNNCGGVINCADGASFSPGEMLSLTNCTISNGKAYSGGGVSNQSFTSSLLVTSCTIDNNYATFSGGGYYLAGSSVTMFDCLITSNTAAAGGGALYSAYNSYPNPVHLYRCTISSNTSSSVGAGGMSIDSPNTSIIMNSTFFNNAANGGANTGGALLLGWNYTGTVQVTNCTICGNSGGNGGGIYASRATVCLTNATIAGNSASGQGGGLYFAGTSMLVMKNTLLANNGPNDFWTGGGSVVDNGYNIIVSTGNRNFTGVGNIIGYRANLGLAAVLAADDTLNGTSTLAISPTSIAIDSGSATANWGIAVPTTDQRGHARVGAPDIGAYENDTPPTRPSSFSGTALSTGSIVWQWQAAANETGYRVKTSTGGRIGPDVPAGTTTYFESGLKPNTTYTRYVEAFMSVLTSTSAAASAVTLAAPPLSAGFSGVLPSTASLSWLSNQNPSYTRYEVYLSTDGFALNFSTPVALSLSYTSTSATFYGLVPNTTYYARVRSFASDAGSTPSDYSNTASMITPAAVPRVSGFGIMVSSVTVSWDPGGNPSGTRYELYLSSDNFALSFSTPVALSSELTAVTTTVTCLSADTTYWFKVRGFQCTDQPGAASDAVPCITLADAPNGISWGAVISTAADVSWAGDTGGNRPGTIYAFHLSSRPDFSGGMISSASVRSAGGAGAVGLTPNTTYYGRVAAINGAGLPSYTGLSPAAVLTPAAAPVSLMVVRTGLTSADLLWDENGNPPYTRYEVSISTVGFSVDVSTLVRVSAGFRNTSTALEGLVRNTTYWLRVRAYGENLEPSGFGTLEYVFIPPTFVTMDLADNGILSYAADVNEDPGDGFECYSSAASTMIYRIDGRGTGRSDFLVSTEGGLLPQYYWDPDNAIKCRISRGALNDDEVSDYLFDSDGDGVLESYFDPAAGNVVRAGSFARVQGVPGYFYDFSGTSDGYDVFFDSSGIASSVVTVVVRDDGRKEHLISTSGGGGQRSRAPGRLASVTAAVPDIYADPYNNIVTPIRLYDYDGDGVLDWGIDTEGNGEYRIYYNPVKGILLAGFAVSETRGYVPSPNPFNPLRGNAVFVYDLTENARVTIEIYDIAGNKVAVLVDGDRSPGRHQFSWNGGNGEFDAVDGSLAGSGNMVAKGVYIVRYKLGSRQTLKKLAIIK